ncbi:MAG: spore coat U domain-containing protein [Rudaea sp.]|uniref:Csu type fimbrial protein n=1 Tax=Rudaea sp. TaxID=2136325 RepID=UPI0039E3710D
MNKKLRYAALVAAVLALGGFASTTMAAATATTSFNVTLTLDATCDTTTLAATALGFGEHTYLDTITSTSTVSIKCSTGTAFNIGLDAGANPGTSGDITTRRMKGGTGSDYVSYQLYTDSGYGTAWGNNSSNGWVAKTGTGSAVTYTVYGKASPISTSPAGSYSDTVGVTVTY